MRITRRNFVFGAGAAALAVVADAACVEPRWLHITQHDVPVAGLPRALDGYRIAQITDAHLRQIGTVEERILREIVHRDAALVVLTGDTIDQSSSRGVFEEFCRNLGGSRRAVVATLGNWEHHVRLRIESLRDIYRAHGIRLLINETASFDGAVRVAATDDAIGGRVVLDPSMSPSAAAPVNIFLTHSPALLDRVPGRFGRFDLTLAGHTHGGQGRVGPFAPVRPPGSGRFVSGWYQVPVGRAYVSRGTGMSIVSARFACRPELPIFTLRQG